MGVVVHAFAAVVFITIGMQGEGLPLRNPNKTRSWKPRRHHLEEAELIKSGIFDPQVSMHGSSQKELVGKFSLLSTTILEETSSGEF